jgi:hypothetical protein
MHAGMRFAVAPKCRGSCPPPSKEGHAWTLSPKAQLQMHAGVELLLCGTAASCPKLDNVVAHNLWLPTTTPRTTTAATRIPPQLLLLLLPQPSTAAAAAARATMQPMACPDCREADAPVLPQLLTKGRRTVDPTSAAAAAAEIDFTPGTATQSVRKGDGVNSQQTPTQTTHKSAW